MHRLVPLLLRARVAGHRRGAHAGEAPGAVRPGPGAGGGRGDAQVRGGGRGRGRLHAGLCGREVGSQGIAEVTLVIL